MSNIKNQILDEVGNINNTTLIEEIDRAIRTILIGGQSYTIGTIELRRANLADLYKMKKELEAAETEDSGFTIGRHSAAVFFDRR